MSITEASTIGEVAAVVAEALERAGIRAVLTGGACASLYSEGAYQSHDLDFIVEGTGRKAALDAAMASVGFARTGDRYVHPHTKLFVEFPTGPLAIGNDLRIEPVSLLLGQGQAWALSPTDACRDRLAAFYHWSDRQSLQVAVEIAQRHDVQMSTIRTWSRQEGAAEKFEEFGLAVQRARRASL